MSDITLDKEKWGLESDSLENNGGPVDNIVGTVDNSPRFGFDLFSKLKAQTGPGSVESYQEHLMNPKKSKGMAQILRGITGIVGELNFAILDIIFGFFQLQKEGKEQNVNVGDTSNQGAFYRNGYNPNSQKGGV